MNVMIRAVLSFVAVSMSACHVGPQIDDLDLAHNPDGATVEVQVLATEEQGKLKFEGELLEIRDDGIIFSGADAKESADEVIFVAWNRAKRVKATRFGGYNADVGRSLEWGAETKERFRLISRFPQGISPEIMDSLLAVHSQEELRRFEL
ncbi:MAG: hypothetical protein ACI88G_001549 [Woeseiaceae bacterium]|jgi:hypothetical protein